MPSKTCVLDLTRTLAGPFCTQVLADQGADVIKIEPLEGDFFRRVGPYASDDTERHHGGLFQSCNRSKRSIALDLKHADGQALLRELVAHADALVENFRAGVMTKLGLGYEALSALNPRLVYTSIRGFGDSPGGRSPNMDWPCFDIVAQAMGGWMGVTGHDAEHPLKLGGGPGDTVAGLFGAFGTLTALWHARASGKGQYVDIAMVDGVLALAESVVSFFAYRGMTMTPAGNGMPGLAPFDTFAAGGRRHRDRRPARSSMARALPAHRSFRAARRSAIRQRDAAMGASSRAPRGDRGIHAGRTKQELREIFGGHVPFGPVQNADDIFADPHFAARDMLPELDHPGSAKRMAVPGVPVKLSVTPGRVRQRAPKLGEHAHEVLAQFGVPGASDRPHCRGRRRRAEVGVRWRPAT
ncbi:MAG: CoA transferase [Burkholderiaceae bacterium]